MNQDIITLLFDDFVILWRIRQDNIRTVSRMLSDAKKLVEKHKQLNHSDAVKVVSHVQREQDDWFINTVMIADCEVPFKFKRKKRYQPLQGARVNITYYPTTELVASMEFEVMKVVRIKRS